VQIAHVELTHVTLPLRLPYHTARHAQAVEAVECVFVRVETRKGRVAWGCAAFDPGLTGETTAAVMRACRACADRLFDTNPLNTEVALAALYPLTVDTPSVRCAFDIALYDLLGLEAGLPLYRLLGGYRHRIQTSITLSLAPVKETVALARERARQGFGIVKLKGGIDAEEDVRRVRAVRTALPHLVLRLDAEEGYSVQEALEVAHVLAGDIEMLEQPTPATSLDALAQVTRQSAVPILADESLVGPPSALEIASRRAAHGMSVKLATCGGLHCARQVESIARAAQMSLMVGCINEPALLIAAGLGLALASPTVRYGDLDGHFDLLDDPTVPGFGLDEGWLVARDVPGLGCSVNL
jgi:L-alanine-DL-glutamate epimerase-like enolase superfamily enzyme